MVLLLLTLLLKLDKNNVTMVLDMFEVDVEIVIGDVTTIYARSN